MNKKFVVGVLATMTISSAVYLKTTYQVLRVIDGDTFETTEHQKIRLSGVEAPELDLCGGTDSKLALEKLILGKRLMVKVLFNDRYKRLVSRVFIQETDVNLAMIASGNAYISRADPEDRPELINAIRIAREQKIGIFGPTCNQASNTQNPKCVIKANISQSYGDRLYRFPGCKEYNNTMVQLYLGENWFCTEQEAIKAGFTKGSDCFDQKF